MRDVIQFSDVPTEYQFDGWRQAVSETCVPPEATTSVGKSFSGTLTSRAFGPTHISQVGGNAVTVRRTSRAIASSDPGHYELGLQVEDCGLVGQDGRVAELNPGDFTVYDTSRPYQLVFGGSWRILVVMFPRELLAVRPIIVNELTARQLSGHAGMGSVALSFLGALGRQLQTNAIHGSIHISDAILDMLAATFTEFHGDKTGPAHQGTPRTLLMRIETYINARLKDPTLTISQIAAAHHVSVRYVQKLFESKGTTVSEWIRSRRLDKCRRDLFDPALHTRPVSAIAAGWGMTDAAHFSRVFKAAYGCSPRDYRLRLPGD
ncbi:helix-turn-helix domain-containing protein [Streptomyces sp. NPDC020490]|uniref:AraC-like ligand-binding domain-containing protein n=1 Tax=Streptomyces sp. NPDC020490 TaxID=3365078 RepID=UPI0037983F72